MTSWPRRLGWWILDYAYAGIWQVRAFLSRTSPATFRSGTLAPIVLLPGVYETWRFLQPLASRMHRRGHPVHVVENLGRSLRPVEEMAERVTEYLASADLRGVIIVAHSKGGLAGKLAMVGAEGARVEGMLAVATPFGGSRYARLMLLPNLRAFAPRHRSIASVARHLDVNARIVSVYAGFDPHIPESSELVGAKNVRLDTGGHFRILDHPRVLGELAAMMPSGATSHDR